MSAPAKTIYDVSELADILRVLVEDSLPSVWVQGEVSNFRNPSGHWYFTLKDAQAQIRCAMFKGKNFSVRPVPRDGDQVLLRAQVSFYTARGDLQLIVEHMEPAGQGALLRAFEQLKARLAKEGLFDEALKRHLPEHPRAIGIVTSATAAALQDILSTLARRYPLAPVYLYPSAVQGAEAPAQLIQALKRLPELAPVDVVILARGGGSLEDLWCFNDEAVARAIRACPVPVVTGIGHEIDFTIADFAADLRAPTPTAAAEQVTPDIADWRQQLGQRGADLVEGVQVLLHESGKELESTRARLQRLHPGRRLGDLAQRMDELGARLGHAAESALRAARIRLSGQRMQLLSRSPAGPLRMLGQGLQHADLHLRRRMQEILVRAEQRQARVSAVLAGLNPNSVLNRGYAIVRLADGDVLRDSAQARPGEELDVRLGRGAIAANVSRIKD